MTNPARLISGKFLRNAGTQETGKYLCRDSAIYPMIAANINIDGSFFSPSALRRRLPVSVVILSSLQRDEREEAKGKKFSEKNRACAATADAIAEFRFQQGGAPGRQGSSAAQKRGAVHQRRH
jgi:hypothetical protein